MVILNINVKNGRNLRDDLINVKVLSRKGCSKKIRKKKMIESFVELTSSSSVLLRGPLLSSLLIQLTVRVKVVSHEDDGTDEGNRRRSDGTRTKKRIRCRPRSKSNWIRPTNGGPSAGFPITRAPLYGLREPTCADHMGGKNGRRGLDRQTRGTHLFRLHPRAVTSVL